MSGLNVRTIQRLESGANASLESQKCLAAALDVDLETLNQETIVINKNADNWDSLPLFLKMWFALNFLQLRPARHTAVRAEFLCHACGFLFCLVGIINEASLIGGLMMLASAHLFTLLKWQGDKYQIWFDRLSPES
jgi:hypothetical protein